MVEDSLIRTAQTKYPLLFPDNDYPVILLAKLQHYGIPTRMMDVTENALVALYFACAGDKKKDGQVIAFSSKTSPVSAYNPCANIIADTYRLTEGAITRLKDFRYRAMNRPYSVRLLYPGWETADNAELQSLINMVSCPMFIDVGIVCDRQQSQGGKFILFPNEITNGEIVSDSLVSINKSNSCYIVERFRIPADYKSVLQMQLKRFGISEQILFPDDIDRVCKAIVNEHKARYPN